MGVFLLTAGKSTPRRPEEEKRIATTSLHPKGTCFAARTGWERQHRDGSSGQAEGDGKGAKGARRNVGKVGAFFALSALFPKK